MAWFLRRKRPYNDEICYVGEACFRQSLCVFHPIWVWWGGVGTKRCRAHNLLMQFSGLGSSKMEFAKLIFSIL